MNGLLKALDAIPPIEWFEILSADEDGVLPPCCGEISDIRDQLIDLRRCPMPTKALRVARALVDSDDHCEVDGIRPLATALFAYLDESRPGWRTERLLTDDDLAVIEANMLIIGRHPSDVPPAGTPASEWATALTSAVTYVAVAVAADPFNAVTYVEGSAPLLVEALNRGAPAAAVLDLYRMSNSLVRAKTREQA